ncbi:hypothetical protein HPP92_009295 [Vanilla planifolia]|uniref:AWS domain-containing protein n=1 Tax=Vanilla planifolia TaxID=51239 RepID=A0A835V6U2_VANPL|nr:hypothetical protein HPP92_009295 [Vanilla planifolia]
MFHYELYDHHGSTISEHADIFLLQDQGDEGPPSYKPIWRNEFSYRKHTKQKEEDIVPCVCLYDPNDQESACGEHCLNVLTSTECTPGCCPCGNFCMNQRFQKCQYAKSILFKTEGRGWGLLAGENIKFGQFVIEYCGEVISWKDAKQRSQAYEAKEKQALLDMDAVMMPFVMS